MIMKTSVDALNIHIYSDRRTMGADAGADVAAKIKELLLVKPAIRMIFAAAPSQKELLSYLTEDQEIEWSRITAFQMEEYLGLPQDAAQMFRHFLHKHLVSQVNPQVVNWIDNANASDIECLRYTQLLQEAPIDIVCLGIGENGHLAFNDPRVADFQDPELVKQVQLDDASRQQQVNDGCFPSFDDVPTHALTLTIPALLAGEFLFCMAPSKSKHQAVKRTLNEPVSPNCPSTILRNHPNCTLYVDRDAYGHV
ncbi:6-phosphogluconolactonase [Paenibacillus sp. HWE-109]|nr:6-phosphogluconolactonase [Paenibacillus sp. HWE-109]UKS27408.1 6-phosphogluconolactonase [Paenibacillus sp. HWE-109]